MKMKNIKLSLISCALIFLALGSGRALCADSGKLEGKKNDPNFSGTIDMKTYKQRKEQRMKATEERKLKAIRKFYESAAALTSTLNEFESKLIGVDNLTSKLNSAVGSVSGAIGDIDNKGGQFDQKDGQVDAVIDQKKKKLQSEIRKAETHYNSLINQRAKYKKCVREHSGRRDAEYYCGHIKNPSDFQIEQAKRNVEKAKRNYNNYLTYGEIEDQEQKAPSMQNAKQSIQDGEASVNNSLADGERLYEAQKDLNDFINKNTRSAIALAQEAKNYARELVGMSSSHSSYIVTDSAKEREFKKDGGKRDKDKMIDGFKATKSSSLVAESTVRNVLSRMEGNSDSANVTELFAITSAATENFKCTNVSDVECTSYHLLVAASAIYLASEIQDESDYRANMDDIANVDDTPDEKYDQQYKEIERAARVREQVLESALRRSEAKQILTDMLDVINTIAILEHQAKIKRIAAAKQQLEKAKAFLKKSEISFAIFVALEILERTFGIMHGILGKIYAACCNPASSGCCVKSPIEFSESQMWWAKQAFSAAQLVFYASRIIKAKKEIKRAKEELAKAEKHTHMSCKVDRAGIALRDRLRGYLEAARYTAGLFSNAIIPLAHAEDKMAQATGINQATALYDFYTVAKFGNSETKGAANEMVEAFPTPETRQAYTTKLLMLGFDVGQGMGNINDELTRQMNIYNQLTQDMDDRMHMDAKSQHPEAGATEELEGITVGKPRSVSKFRPGGALSTSDFATQGNREGGQGSGKISSGDMDRGDLYTSSTLGRNAQAYKENFDEAKNDVFNKLEKSGMDVRSGDADDFDKYRADRAAQLKKIGQGSKTYSSLIRKQLEKMDKNKDDAKKKLAEDGKGKKKSGVKLKTKGGKSANQVASGKGKGAPKMSSGVSMFFDDSDSTVDVEEASESELSPGDADQRAGEAALAGMKDSAYGRYENNDNQSDEKGIYSGEKTIFGILSNRYIKTALPLFFEKKKK